MVRLLVRLLVRKVVNSVGTRGKKSKGNLPGGEFFLTKIFFQITISQQLIRVPPRYLHHFKTHVQGIQKRLQHIPTPTTSYSMHFQT